MTEAQEQMMLINYLKAKKIFHYANVNENQMSSVSKAMAIRVGAKHKALGKLAGTPDITILLKHKILYIEMKQAPKKLKSGRFSLSHTKVSDSQEAFISKVNEFDYVSAEVCYGFLQAKAFIEEELKCV